jgi:hypothetical protein
MERGGWRARWCAAVGGVGGGEAAVSRLDSSFVPRDGTAANELCPAEEASFARSLVFRRDGVGRGAEGQGGREDWEGAEVYRPSPRRCAGTVSRTVNRVFSGIVATRGPAPGRPPFIAISARGFHFLRLPLVRAIKAPSAVIGRGGGLSRRPGKTGA